MKKWGFSVLVFLLYLNLCAQQEVADSLLAIAKNKSGIEKADVLNELAEKLLDTNPDKSIVYAGEALKIWEAENDATNAFYSLLFMSNAHSNKGNQDSALIILLKAQKDYEERLTPVYASQLNMHIGMAYNASKNFEKALQHHLIALKLLSDLDENNKKSGIKMLEMNIQKSIGDLFSNLENYNKALTHYSEALTLSIQRSDSLNMAFIYNSIGIAYEQQKNFTLGIESYFKAMKILERLGHISAIGNIKVNISLLYYFKGEFDSALNIAKEALTILEHSPNRYALAINLSTIGRIYLKMDKADEAYEYIVKSYQMGLDNGYTDLITDSYDFLGQYHALKRNYEDAYKFNRRYIQHKDSIYNFELSSKIHELQTRYETEKKEQEIALLTKDGEIKDLQLQRQEALLISLAGVFVLLIFVGVLWFRSIRQKQRLEKSEMDKRNLETEQKLLRAQINPHFMFNALNSVQSYISANNNLKAMTYLAKFSQLMRNILEISRKSMISLEDEIETLRLYMELEAMRFKNMFAFDISVCDEIIPSKTYIPPMLVQPFVENSIKHGFRHIENGKLIVDFFYINGVISCRVQDNGIGRQKAQAQKSDATHKSLGMQVTRERFEILKTEIQQEIGFEIEDMKNADGSPCGTLVKLHLPYEIE